MNEISDFTVGLDIGTSKVRAVAACLVASENSRKKRVDIIDYVEIPHSGSKHGVISNIDKVVQAVADAISMLENKIDCYQIQSVVLGVSGKDVHTQKHSSYRTLFNENPIAKKDIEDMANEVYRKITDSNIRTLHVISQEYAVDGDWEIRDPSPIGMVGTELEGIFEVVSISSKSLSHLETCVQDKNRLYVEDKILNPIACGDAVLTDEEKEGGVALVDIGAGTTEIAIYHKGALRHAAVLPIGGEAITSDIQKGVCVIERDAEKLKVKLGCAFVDKVINNKYINLEMRKGKPERLISKKNLANIIQARMEDIIDQIMIEIETAGYKNLLTRGIVLTGGTAEMDGLKELLEYCTGMDITIGYPVEHLGNVVDNEVKQPRFATAIGLAISPYREELRLDNSFLTVRDWALGTTDKSLVNKGSTQKSSKKEWWSNGLNGFMFKFDNFLMDNFDDQAKETY